MAESQNHNGKSMSHGTYVYSHTESFAQCANTYPNVTILVRIRNIH